MRLTALPAPTPPVTALGLRFDPARAVRRGADAGEALRVLRDALALGVTLVEVAADDDAVAEVAAAARDAGRRDQIAIAAEIRPLEPSPLVPDTFAARLPAARVQAELERRLRASRLDAVPVLQLAGLRAAWLRDRRWPEVVDACARLVREGKALCWGAAVDTPAAPPPALVGGEPRARGGSGPTAPPPGDDGDLADDLRPLLDAPGLACLAVPFHLARRAAAPLIEAAAARQVAVVARRPLYGGLLGGDLAPGARLAPRDDRRALTPAQLAEVAVAVARLAALVRDPPPAARATDEARAAHHAALDGRPADLPCRTVAELALRFVLGHPGVAAAAPAISRRDHLEEALAAATSPPLPDDLRALL